MPGHMPGLVRMTQKGYKIDRYRRILICCSTSIMIDKELETDPQKIAEGCNSYFSSIAEKLQQNQEFSNNDFSKYLSTPLQGVSKKATDL